MKRRSNIGTPIVHETLRDLYDSNPEYVSRRNASSHSAQQIELEVRQFKIPGLVSVIPAGCSYSTVMEIGCATGELLAAFPERSSDGSRVRKIGFDISPLNIQAAKARHPDIDFRAGNFIEATVRADVVILSDILEHVPDDIEFLRSAAQCCQLVLINLPLERSWSNAYRNYGLQDPSGHLRAYSLQDGLKLIDSAGLRVLHSLQVWSHESAYDLERRQLRARHFGRAYSGAAPVRLCKAIFHTLARLAPPLGRRFYPSNLFVSAALRS